jgi:hypothetical protein
MYRLILAIALLAPVTLAAGAEAPSFSQLKSEHPVRLTAPELQQLLPGAKVVNVTSNGSTRSWRNKPDGTLVASSDNRGINSGRSLPTSGDGSWHIDKRGRWCVSIQWMRSKDDWCRYMFKAGGKYYGYSQLEDNAVGHEYLISQ